MPTRGRWRARAVLSRFTTPNKPTLPPHNTHKMMMMLIRCCIGYSVHHCALQNFGDFSRFSVVKTEATQPLPLPLPIKPHHQNSLVAFIHSCLRCDSVSLFRFRLGEWGGFCVAESGEGVIALHFSQLPFIPYLLYSMMMVANFFASYHSLSDFYPLAISFSHSLSLSLVLILVWGTVGE